MKEKRLAGAALYHIIIFAIGIIMVYPLIWMVMSSFKETNTIFTTASSLIPEHFVTDNYANGWKGFAKISFSTFFKNSIFISVIATIGTIASSAVVAYGFARFKFRGKGILFSAMLLSMMLPAQVLMIPQYLWYQKLGWVGSFLPLTVPYFFAIQGFFVYLLSNFIGGIPIELDEAAKIDGATIIQQIRNVELPALKPVIVIQFILSAGNIMSIGFEKVYAMQTDLNKITSDIIPTYVYRLGLEMGDYGYSTAVGLFNSIVNLILLVAVNYVVSKLNEGEGL